MLTSLQESLTSDVTELRIRTIDHVKLRLKCAILIQNWQQNNMYICIYAWIRGEPETDKRNTHHQNFAWKIQNSWYLKIFQSMEQIVQPRLWLYQAETGSDARQQ